MNEAALFAFFPQDVGVVGVLSLVSLLAVWLPLYRGIRLCQRARAATRCVPAAALRASLGKPPGGPEPLSLLMLRVLLDSLRDRSQPGWSGEFVLDASRQYVSHEYDASYARIISMYANLLPPIGFIGTTSGMLVLFLSMHLGSDSLELGALAIALTSSIFALCGFALLEGLKIRLYGRLLLSLDEVVALYRSLRNQERAAAGVSESPFNAPA